MDPFVDCCLQCILSLPLLPSSMADALPMEFFARKFNCWYEDWEKLHQKNRGKTADDKEVHSVFFEKYNGMVWYDPDPKYKRTVVCTDVEYDGKNGGWLVISRELGDSVGDTEHTWLPECVCYTLRDSHLGKRKDGKEVPKIKQPPEISCRVVTWEEEKGIPISLDYST